MCCAIYVVMQHTSTYVVRSLNIPYWPEYKTALIIRRIAPMMKKSEHPCSNGLQRKLMTANHWSWVTRWGQLIWLCFALNNRAVSISIDTMRSINEVLVTPTPTHQCRRQSWSWFYLTPLYFPLQTSCLVTSKPETEASNEFILVHCITSNFLFHNGHSHFGTVTLMRDVWDKKKVKTAHFFSSKTLCNTSSPGRLRHTRRLEAHVSDSEVAGFL